MIVGVIGLVALAPRMLSLPPFRDAVPRRASVMGPARIRAGDLKLSWLTPAEIRRLRLTTPDDVPLVTVTNITTDIPLWRQLLTPHRLGNIQLIEESPVHFEMAEGRVWHQGLRFEVGTLSVETSGYVGIDQSLDLVAAVTLPEFGKRDSLLVSSLSRRRIEIPIHGTLQAPLASGSGLLDEGRELVRTKRRERRNDQ